MVQRRFSSVGKFIAAVAETFAGVSFTICCGASLDVSARYLSDLLIELYRMSLQTVDGYAHSVFL